MALRSSSPSPGGEKQPLEIPERFRCGGIYFILILAVTKRKPARFSATKAVKANARERVGQPKPARVIQPVPRTGRQAKHKPQLEDLIREEQ